MPQNKQTTAAGAASKIRIFRKNRRAWFSLWILAGLLVLSLLAEFLANDRPLLVKYKGEWYFPLFNTYLDRDFGGDFPTPADYADPYIRKNIEQNGWMLMPIIPYSFNTVDMEMDQPTPAALSARHWLGTDDEGRDIVARIIYGLRLSLVFAFLLTLISSAIGIFAGAVQGYFGGRTDIFMQRFIEIWESLPQLFILIIVSSMFMPTFASLLIILLFFSWPALTGMVRAEFMRIRNFEFVKAARVLGVSNRRIICRHILPNALVSAVTFIPFIMSEAIVSLTALDFLGLGLSHEYPSLGDLVRQGKDNLQAPWIGISIFVVLSVLLTALIFVGEGVRDMLDTRKNRR